MRGIIFLPDRDTTDHADYSGAFRVEADRCAKVFPGLQVQEVDISRGEPGRQEQVLQALAQAAGPLDLVGFLCHGTKHGLQLGLHRVHAPALAAAIAQQAVGAVSVVLWACSTASGDGPGGDGGFADLLRDALSRCVGQDGQPLRQVRVDAHDRPGHCCSNPHVRRFESPAGPGGAWLIEPDTDLWPAWVAALRDRHGGSTLRFRFPLLSAEELHHELTR